MRNFISKASLVGLGMLLVPSHGLVPQQQSEQTSRRELFAKSVAAVASTPLIFQQPEPVFAATSNPKDCYADCYKNCRQIVPKDPTNYCAEQCRDYCAQEDRQDGLSGSVSSSGGETGILGGTFGTGTVVKGEDKPPSVSIPGLDFSNGKGKELIGYKN